MRVGRLDLTLDLEAGEESEAVEAVKMLIDLGDVSEDALGLAPETFTVTGGDTTALASAISQLASRPLVVQIDGRPHVRCYSIVSSPW